MKRVLRLAAGPDTFTPELVETVVAEFTEPGDVVFDPFAGFGTTLAVAERMGRRAVGLELLPDRVESARAGLSNPDALRCADARTIAHLDLPPIDLCFTSPPYMTRIDHAENPLSGYQTLDGDYDTYLAQLAAIFGDVKRQLAPDATVVINAANLRLYKTRLAWDIAAAVSNVLTFEYEVVVDWGDAHTWLLNDYCLVFTA